MSNYQAIPDYLLSSCAGKTLLCYECTNAIKLNQHSGRWFITMGHPGFNSQANNGAGYRSRAIAVVALRYFGRKGGE